MFLFLLLCNFLLSTNVYSANDSIKIKIVTDSSKTEIRKLSDEEQKKLLDNTDYKYDRVGPAPKSVWERFTEWFWRTIEKIFSTKGGKIGFNIFKFILIIAVIVIIIFLLLKNDVRALFYGKSASVQIDFSEFEENIHTINFDVLIDEAISKKDFRKAVRLHFLKLLKELTDNNLIKWQIDKTNNDYSIELANSKYSSQFKELALLYEYIWYGDFQLDESNFKATISKFKDFRIIV
ncbi:MAG: hypothetical protein ACXVDZ_08530 [Bacteroidia bacterium]